MIKKGKIWNIKGYQGTFSDDEIINLIKDKKITGDNSLTTREMKKWVKIKDSIYQYYLEEDKDETI